MTPDAVIFRYLRILSGAAIDVDALCAVVTADADLLHRWLRIYDLPADYQQLFNAMAASNDGELRHLANVQAWSMNAPNGSARLSIDLWQSVLRSALLGGHLYAHVQHETDLNIDLRLRNLLALSGVQLPADPRLQELNEFRGIDPALLEDASLELRVFAVVDGVETGRDEDLARLLLGIANHDYQDILAQAEQSTQEYMQQIDIDPSLDVDWQHQIWLQQRVSIAGSAFLSCRKMDELAHMHLQVSRCLFNQPPLLMIEELMVEDASNARMVVQPARLDGRNLSVPINSNTSSIAAVVRSRGEQMLTDAAQVAVVDRQILRSMDVEEAHVVCAGEHPRVVLIVNPDEDIDVAAAARLYVQEFVKHSQRISSQQDEPAGNPALNAFREAETNRLREIVHEANNPLSIVHNYLHILELRLRSEPETAEQIQLIASELKRAGEIFASARNIPSEVAVVPPAELQSQPLGEWLRGQVELHQGLAANAGVALAMRAIEQDLEVEVDFDRLAQVVTNLLKNAIEACAAGDRVRAGLDAQVFRAGQAGVEIFVEDTGPGMDAGMLARLTESKTSSKGGDHQGVGLKLVYAISAELGVSLDMRTSENGTRFTLFIPASP